MIVSGYSDEMILNELHADLADIKSDARKAAKRKLISIVSSGITSKEYVYEQEVISPRHNRWFVTTTIKANRRGAITIRACCIYEGDKGRDYLIVRGTKWGGLFFLRVYSHVIKRMKEREYKFKGMDSRSVCNRMFNPNEQAYMFYTEKEDIDRFWTDEVKEDVNSMMVARSGIYFGKLFRDDSSCYLNIKTYINPVMLATHEQYDMYRCARLHMELEKYSHDRVEGNNCIAYMDMTPESERILRDINDYKTNDFFIDGMQVIPE